MKKRQIEVARAKGIFKPLLSGKEKHKKRERNRAKLREALAPVPPPPAPVPTKSFTGLPLFPQVLENGKLVVKV